MVYQWKRGSRMDGFDAGKIGSEIETIGKAITAKDVVIKASDSKSAMHDYFEWDDEKAGMEYRLTQARSLMRSLVVVTEAHGAPKDQVTIRAYEHVDLGKESGDNRMAYVPTQSALATPDLRKQVIGRLYSDISEAEDTARKYEYLVAEFEEVSIKLGEAKKAIPT